MSRRRRRRAGSSGPRLIPSSLVVAIVAVGLALTFGPGVGLPAAGFDTGSADRRSAAPLAADGDAVLSLDIAAGVDAGETDPLVNVTNRLGRDATVTVSLADGSRDVGSLVVDGTAVGNETSLLLAQGATEQVSLAADADTSGRTVSFHVNASDGGLSATAADRSTEVR